jgi:chemotaxis protein CheX
MAKILVIEDDRELLATYVSVLVGEGHKIVQSSNGQEGLAKFQNENFDLIITDLNMPKLSGQRFIENLQRSGTPTNCPIIISSGHIDDTIIKSFSNDSKVHFLPKPTSLKELKNKVKEILGKDFQKPKVDVRFINPILSSTIEVIEAMTQLKIEAGKPYIKILGERSGDISGIVGVVSSGFKGSISLSFSEIGFLAIVSKMFQEEIKTIDDENKDAVAELLNIIFGKAKKILNENGMNIQPAIPTIVRGKDHTIEHQSQNQTIVIPFQCKDLGDFRVEVSSAS